VNSISDDRYWQDSADYKRFYQSMEEAAHLLVAPDEMLWIDRHVAPDRAVDVALNLSCSTQFVPHFMLDAVAVLDALGVNFTAGASKVFCCGTYFRRMGKLHGTTRLNAASTARMVAWAHGARFTPAPSASTRARRSHGDRHMRPGKRAVSSTRSSCASSTNV
jgi:Fe-S oxidoreductase